MSKVTYLGAEISQYRDGVAENAIRVAATLGCWHWVSSPLYLDIEKSEALRIAQREVERCLNKNIVPGPRVLFVGYGRHGKDVGAYALHRFGSFVNGVSTSWAATPFVAKALGIPESYAFEHRHEDRQFWKDYCDHLRKEDPLFLVRKCLATGNVIAGVRDEVEIAQAVRERIFDRIVWVERPGFPTDPTVTFDPAKYCTDRIINDGTLDQYRDVVRLWATANFSKLPTLDVDPNLANWAFSRTLRF